MWRMTPGTILSLLGKPQGVVSLVALPPGTPAAGDARLCLPADLMFAWKLPAAAVAAVALVDGQAVPRSLRQAFERQLAVRIPPGSVCSGSLGEFVVLAELWPAPRLAKGTAAASPVLRDALGLPNPGTQLAVFLLPPGAGAGLQPECSTVFLRLCTMQVALAPSPALLPPLAKAGQDEAPASPASVRTGGAGSGLVQSPAMRGSSSTPVALSPAMRGGNGRKAAAVSPAMRSSSSGGGEGTPVGLPSRGTLTGKAGVAPRASSSSGELWQAASETDRLQCSAVLALLLQGEGRASPLLRSLVEQLILRQLLSRRLLPGNFVAVQILGQRAVFVVESTALAAPSEPSATNDSHTSSWEPEQQHWGDGNSSSSSSANSGPGSRPTGPITLRCKVCLLPGAKEGGEPPGTPGLPQAGPASYAQAAAAAATEAVGGGTEGAAAKSAFRAASAGAASCGMEFPGLGGAAGPKHALQELVSMPLRAPHVFAHYGVVPPRGILLYGPPGTGKTVLACAAAASASAKLFVINGPDVVSEYFGESEAGLRGVFAAAKALAPSVVFIDELDAIAPSRGGAAGAASRSTSGGGVSGRMVATLLMEMDNLGDDQVVLIAATNRPDAIDPAMRRPGRFDREVEVGVPSPADRRDILHKQLAAMRHNLTDTQVAELADAAHGFVPADLAALCNEAALAALRRVQQQQQRAGDLQHLGATTAGGLSISLADFKAAETRVRPSALREVAVELPKVRWEDVGGLEEVKQRLKEAVEWPFKNPEALDRLGAKAPKGILLYGPPGCSKTLLARAVASEARLNFLAIKGPELYSKYVGESEKAIATLFARARAASPSVIFFDELDGLASSREDEGEGGVSVGDRVLSQLLQEMDGLQARQSVIVIAATNRLDCIDPALMRPGRLERMLYISPPDENAREAILEVHTRHMPLSADVKLRDLAMQCFGFSGADVMALCREAALAALEETLDAEEVCMRNFQTGLLRVQPSFL